MKQTFDPSDLLQHLDWARSLARSLLREDPAAADDAAQDAWLATMRRPPPEKAAIRPWLATILRRRASKYKNRERMRAERERAASRREATESTADAVARAAAHRDVVSALMALDEPYRETLILRFFEGLGPTEIADRQGVSVETVRSRVRRGLATLRGRLEREHGDAARATLLLLADARPKDATATVATTTSRLALSSLLVLAITVSTLLWWPSRPTGDDASSAPPLAREADQSMRAPEATRSPVAVPTSAAETATSGPDAPTGRLIGLDGRPLAGVTLRRDSPHTVRWQGGDVGWLSNSRRSLRLSDDQLAELRRDRTRAAEWFAQFEFGAEWRATLLGESIPAREVRTDERGSFRLGSEPDASPLRYTATGGFAVLARGIDEAGRPTWIACRATDVEGRTLRMDGSAIEDGFVQWKLARDGDLLQRVDAQAASVEVRSEKNGFYRLRDVPVSTSVTIAARAADDLRAERPLVAALAAKFDLWLGDAARERQIVAGIVLGPSGAPVADAAVALGRKTILTDTRGAFDFGPVALGSGASLTAWKPGFTATRVAHFARAVRLARVAPAALVLRFARKPRAIRGRVVDASGATRRQARVALHNPMQLDYSFTPLEARVGERGRSVRCDARGRFELTGLDDRPYRLRIWDERGMPLLVSAPIRPSQQEIVIRVAAPRKRIGRIEADGKPVANAKIVVSFRTFANASGAGTMSEISAIAQSGPDGSFTIEAPARHGCLLVEDAAGRRSVHPIAGLALEGPLVLQHEPSRRFAQVLPPFAVRAETARLVDKSGQPIPVRELDAGRVSTRRELDVRNGRAPWIELPERDVAIVLYRGDTEITRSPIPAEGSSIVLRGAAR